MPRFILLLWELFIKNIFFTKYEFKFLWPHFFLTNAQIIWWIYDGIYSHIWNGSMIWQGQELVCVDRKVFLWDGPWLYNKHAPDYWLPFHVEGAISSLSFQQQTFQGKYKTVYWLRICIISIWRKKAKRIRKKIFSDKY